MTDSHNQLAHYYQDPPYPLRPMPAHKTGRTATASTQAVPSRSTLPLAAGRRGRTRTPVLRSVPVAQWYPQPMMTVPTGSASESYIARRISSMPAVGARTMPSRICFCCSMGGGVHDERMRSPRRNLHSKNAPLLLLLDGRRQALLGEAVRMWIGGVDRRQDGSIGCRWIASISASGR